MSAPVLPTASYAVTGANGHLGRLAVDALLRRGIPARHVFALAPDTDRLDDVAGLGVGIREADFRRPDTLRPALDGIERLLLVAGDDVGRRIDQHTAVVDAANDADVGFVVYTSVVGADDTELVLAPEHAATEQVLETSGLPFASARSSVAVEVYTARLEDYLDAGEIVGAAGDGRVSATTRADLAEAAVALLAGDIVESTGYHELGGPAFSMSELARTITDVTGTTVAYRDLSPEDLTAELVRAGIDGETAGFVASVDASIARGELETTSDVLERLLGRAPTALEAAVRAARA